MRFSLYQRPIIKLGPKLHIDRKAETTRLCTGKSLSEALIFASNNPQYDDRLFIELEAQYMKNPSSENGENMWCTEIVFDIPNMFFPCSAKRRASDKDLPAPSYVTVFFVALSLVTTLGVVIVVGYVSRKGKISFNSGF